MKTRTASRRTLARFAILTAIAAAAAIPWPAIGQQSGTLHAFLIGDQPGWQMISAPFSFTSSFTDMGISVDAWQPLKNQYAVTPDAPADSFQLGQGYWLYVTDFVPIQGPGTVADTSKPFQIPLQAGWNQIGNPFLSSVPIDNISVVSSTGTGESLTTAIALGNVSPLYPYDPVAGQYTPLSASGQSLDPWLGAWVFTFKPATLKISAPAPVVLEDMVDLSAGTTSDLTANSDPGGPTIGQSFVNCDVVSSTAPSSTSSATPFPAGTQPAPVIVPINGSPTSTAPPTALRGGYLTFAVGIPATTGFVPAVFVGVNGLQDYLDFVPQDPSAPLSPGTLPPGEATGAIGSAEAGFNTAGGKVSPATDSFTLYGLRIRSSTLPGSYSLVVTYRDTNGNISLPATLNFKVS